MSNESYLELKVSGDESRTFDALSLMLLLEKHAITRNEDHASILKKAETLIKNPEQLDSDIVKRFAVKINQKYEQLLNLSAVLRAESTAELTADQTKNVTEFLSALLYLKFFVSVNFPNKDSLLPKDMLFKDKSDDYMKDLLSSLKNSSSVSQDDVVALYRGLLEMLCCGDQRPVVMTESDFNNYEGGHRLVFVISNNNVSLHIHKANPTLVEAAEHLGLASFPDFSLTEEEPVSPTAEHTAEPRSYTKVLMIAALVLAGIALIGVTAWFFGPVIIQGLAAAGLGASAMKSDQGIVAEERLPAKSPVARHDKPVARPAQSERTRIPVKIFRTKPGDKSVSNNFVPRRPSTAVGRGFR